MPVCVASWHARLPVSQAVTARSAKPLSQTCGQFKRPSSSLGRRLELWILCPVFTNQWSPMSRNGVPLALERTYCIAQICISAPMYTNASLCTR